MTSHSRISVTFSDPFEDEKSAGPEEIERKLTASIARRLHTIHGTFALDQMSLLDVLHALNVVQCGDQLYVLGQANVWEQTNAEAVTRLAARLVEDNTAR